MAVMNTFFKFAALATLAASACAQTPPTVNLTYSSYEGAFNTTNNITSFVGIRYAAPPTGTLRFQAPQTPTSTAGVQAATANPPQCYQAPTGTDLVNPFTALSGQGVGYERMVKRQTNTTTSEDCLFLNVFVPGSNGSLPANGTLPVLVYIHGGGYLQGSATMYDGTDLIVDSNNTAVVVVIQYRLGLFGFLPGAAVKAGGALNAGLLDQRLALQWVQDYIGLFGGNSSLVTIWGESAGAGSVFQHIIANNGSTDPPLFRAAMTSSTFLPSQFWYNATVPEAVYTKVANGSGCCGANSTFACLQKADVGTLEKVNTNINNEGYFGTFVTVPVIDGEFIVDSPTAILKGGNANGEALLAFTNPFEGSIFVSNATNSSSTTNATLYAQQLFPFLNDSQVQQIAALYANDTEDVDALAQSIGIQGESIFICPTYLLLQTFVALNRSQWKGEFAIPPGSHAEDLMYYFNPPGSLPPFANASFQQSFAQSFLSFVVSPASDPNDKIDNTTLTPTWPTWNSTSPGTEMLFNTTNGTTASAQPVVQTISTNQTLLERCAFWQSLAPIVGQ